MKKYLNLGLAVVIIVAFISGIFQKEELIAEGDTVYLALAPVDPRSIMQGDYMRLRFEAGTVAQKDVNKLDEKSGYLVMNVDEKKAATFTAFFDGQTITDDQILFKYQVDGYRIKLQPNSFLFQQGLGEIYAMAKYGIFKINGKEHLLVGMADGDLNEIKPPKPETKAD